MRKHIKKSFKMTPKIVPGGSQNRAPALPRAPPGYRDLPGTSPGPPGTSFWQPRSSPGQHFDAVLVGFGPSSGRFGIEFQEQLAATPSRVFNEFPEAGAAATIAATTTTTITTMTSITTITTITTNDNNDNNDTNDDDENNDRINARARGRLSPQAS